MACAGCKRRQQILIEAVKKDGVRGAINALPKIAADLVGREKFGKRKRRIRKP